MRDMLFVSHANPEDNDFARWLALRLAREGYGVWCDLTKLLGGEVFWDDIEDAIRNRTAKFLYVLSRTSNEKQGARNELALAKATAKTLGVDEFIIPLWIDDLSPADFNIELHRLTAIQFTSSWASGLAQLLKCLADAGVSKKAGFDASSVSQWWGDHIAARRIVKNEPEQLVTNWYQLRPTTLFFHELTRDGMGSLSISDSIPYPAVKHDQYLVSFAPAEDFSGSLGPGVRIAGTLERSVNDAAESRPRLWSYRDERRHLTNLLRQAWTRLLRHRSLPTYEFANGSIGFYYRMGQVERDTIWFTQYGGGASRRQIVGYNTTRKDENGVPIAKRMWHFTLEARPTSKPVLGYTMRAHVLFSDDGMNIWPSKDRLQRARRSLCKNWWNDDWRDRINAMVQSLSDGEGTIALRVGAATTVYVDRNPIILESPVSYDETSAVKQEVEFDDDEIEEIAGEAGEFSAPQAACDPEAILEGN